MTERAFAPYALEIGHLARSWNQLHENLCLIFCRVATHNDTNIGRAIWYAIKSDKTQRDILRAACLAPGAIDKRNRPTGAEDIKNLLNDTDTFSSQRNIAMHTPFMVGMAVTTREMTVMADFFPNNPHAKQVRGKDALRELSYYRAKCDILKDHALSIWLALGHPELPWPSKHLLPNREQVTYRTPSRGKKRTKSPPPPPQS